MKTMTVGEFKSHFSDVLEQVKAGVSFAVTYGRKKEVVGYFLPEQQVTKTQRKLGTLTESASVEFAADYQMSDEDLLG